MNTGSVEKPEPNPLLIVV